MIIIGILLLVVIGGLVYVGRRAQKDVDPLEQRLADFAAADDLPTSLQQVEEGLSFQERIVIPMYNALAKFTIKLTPEKQIEDVRIKIDRAGLTGKVKPMTLFGQRLALTLALGGGAFFLFMFLTSWPTNRAILATIAGAAIGYQLPILQLSSKIARRQDNVVKYLPDALDLMVICVEAGLGFDQAMDRVYQKWDNDLGVAFGRIIQEIQVGKTRRDALRDMADKLDVKDFTTFAAAIIQADQLGVSIGKVLRIQSEQMRIKRRQRAQEKAQQAPVKMMIPMTFFIFPSIWIVLLGPSVITVMELGIFG